MRHTHTTLTAELANNIGKYVTGDANVVSLVFTVQYLGKRRTRAVGIRTKASTRFCNAHSERRNMMLQSIESSGRALLKETHAILSNMFEGGPLVILAHTLCTRHASKQDRTNATPVFFKKAFAAGIVVPK